MERLWMVGGGGWGIDWFSFASGILLVWIFWRERDGSTAVLWGCCEHGLRVFWFDGGCLSPSFFLLLS